MKCSESWLREWINPKKSLVELAEILTMGGLEVEEIAPVAPAFDGVVIGEIVTIQKHPEADRLNICEVNAAQEKPLQIVCGAPNVKVGMKAPLAMIGAVLPNNVKIKPAKLRNVDSQGMLCSAADLGMPDATDGLLELSADAPVGKSLREYLQLEDQTIDVSITPNRGDCLSVRGLARDVAALTTTELNLPTIEPVKTQTDASLALLIEAKAGCPRYVGRAIKNVKADAITPVWLQERLRRSGIRRINPIVDVTNYVMLELGQPMHAFDFDKVDSELRVRISSAGEKITLLDGSEKTLDNETLIIADAKNPLAIAGVMGGVDSSVTLNTKNIFLESAFFTPTVIARQRQFYNLNSDSAYRFERGVDYTIQREAIERATKLILEICGGEPGPVNEQVFQEHLPKHNAIIFSHDKIAKVLGIELTTAEVENIFHGLGFAYQLNNNSWNVTAPTYRPDIVLAEDVIEEIARLNGYNKIPMHAISARLQMDTATVATARDLKALRQAFSDAGFHEVISYSFVEQKLQAILDPETPAREILNPITAEMSVMRTNLWPGLINTLLYNKSRQQQRIRLFEFGTCFITTGDKLSQQSKLAGLVTGNAVPEQWATQNREVDFYDLKGALENILASVIPANELEFKLDTHPALHPGQSAGIYYKNKRIGQLGMLHPQAMQKLDLTAKVYIFELDLADFDSLNDLRAQEISKFPEIRRDLAILVNQTVPAKEIQDTIKGIAGDWLKDVFIFDVYQGKGIAPGIKSIALALVLQHPTRTLVDEEITGLVNTVVETLKGKLGAELRS